MKLWTTRTVSECYRLQAAMELGFDFNYNPLTFEYRFRDIDAPKDGYFYYITKDNLLQVCLEDFLNDLVTQYEKSSI